jgi:hypothetical protein
MRLGFQIFHEFVTFVEMLELLSDRDAKERIAWLFSQSVGSTTEVTLADSSVTRGILHKATFEVGVMPPNCLFPMSKGVFFLFFFRFGGKKFDLI